MKQSEIKVGVTYHDGKRGARQVVGMGPEFVLYEGQENKECLRYRQVKGLNLGYEGNMTRVSFAHWAKGIVEVKS